MTRPPMALDAEIWTGPRSPRETARERYIREEFAAFMEDWRAERRNWPTGYVPARLITCPTGVMWDLMQAGLVIRDGERYAPEGWNDCQD